MHAANRGRQPIQLLKRLKIRMAMPGNRSNDRKRKVAAS